MNAVVQHQSVMNSLIPRSMNEAIQLAELMARGKMMPEHLRNPGDALMVIEQAMRWQMSPYAVAQATFSIKGKLLFAGTLVAAAIEHSGAIVGHMDYQFTGEGLTRKIIVSATRKGEASPRTVEVALKDAQTANENWKKQPDQQLVYHGARVWGRRWTPGVMLGVYSPEEMSETPPDTFRGTTIEATPETPAAKWETPPQRAEITDPVAWLKQLDVDLAAAQTAEEIDEILAAPDVQTAQDHARNGAKARLDKMIAAAVHRARSMETSAPDDDSADMAEQEARDNDRGDIKTGVVV